MYLHLHRCTWSASIYTGSASTSLQSARFANVHISISISIYLSIDIYIYICIYIYLYLYLYLYLCPPLHVLRRIWSASICTGSESIYLQSVRRGKHLFLYLSSCIYLSRSRSRSISIPISTFTSTPLHKIGVNLHGERIDLPPICQVRKCPHRDVYISMSIYLYLSIYIYIYKYIDLFPSICQVRKCPYLYLYLCRSIYIYLSSYTYRANPSEFRLRVSSVWL